MASGSIPSIPSIPASGARSRTRPEETPSPGAAAAGVDAETREPRKERRRPASRTASAIAARRTDFFLPMPLVEVGDVIDEGRVELHLIEQVRAHPDDVQVVLVDDAGHGGHLG